MAISTYPPRNLSHQKCQKERENWKLWDCPCILRNKASYVNDSPNTLALDITYMTCREAACPTDDFLYRLQLLYQGHPTTFFCKICWTEQILCLEISKMGPFSLVLRWSQTTHLPSRKFVAPDLLWRPQRRCCCARLKNLAIQDRCAKMYYKTYALKT